MGRAVRFVLVAALLAVLSAVAIAPGAGADSPRSAGDPWSDAGPAAVVVGALDDAHTVYRPADLGSPGTLHPVIVWGNGTGATVGTYDGLLRLWASHGFVVAAADTPNAGTGREMLDGADALLAENGRDGSPFFQRIDPARIGAAGHSQGGGGAIAAGADPRITTVVPIQPGPQGSVAALHGPMLALAGQLDVIAAPPVFVLPRYEQADRIPAVYAERAGATHFEPTGDGGGFRSATTAWFRFWLAGDADAGRQFFGPCAICSDPAWSDVRRNDRALAVPAP